MGLLGFWLGFTAMTTQILMLRELLVQFSGNELAISIILGSWMFWTALGNFIVSFLKKGQALANDYATGIILWLVALLIPLEVFAARLIRIYWSALPGEMLGADKIFLTSFFLLAPACLLLGGLFVLYIERALGAGQVGQATGTIYIIEAVGASVGGLFFTFVLVRLFSDLQIALLIGLLNLMLALFLSYARPWRSLVGILLVLLCWSGIAYFLRINPNPDWPGYEIRQKVDTVYGRLVVASRSEGEFSFFSDRHHLVSTPDRLSAEEAVHWAALQQPRLRSALLIGGIGESVGEILKYPHIDRVSLVELDAGLIELALKHFPPPVRSYLTDAKVEIINSDGRHFVKTTSSHYDLVLLNLPDSSTASINRFYTVEFFSEVKRLLNPEGIFSFGVSGAQNFYRETQLVQLASLQSSLLRVFSQVLVIPGDTVVFLASERKTPLASDKTAYLRLLEVAGIDTAYVSKAYIPARLEHYRMLNFQKSLQETENFQLNHDFHPMSYYYNLILWSDYFNERWGKVLRQLLRVNPLWLWWGIGGGLVFLFGLRIMRLFPRVFSPAVSIFTAGFAEISSELLIILCFQIFYGNVYQKIGLILASFMVGLAMGGYLVIKVGLGRRQMFYYKIVQATISLYPLLIMGSLQIMKDFTALGVFRAVLPLLTLGLGFLGGVQFPLAVEIICAHTKNEKVTGGVLNGIDLLGATLGAVLLLSFLVPIQGIYPTLLFLSFMNFAAFVFVL